MKKVIFSVLALAGLLCGACEDDITPSINIESEYAYLTELGPNSTHADSVISEWFQKYECAVLYNFEEKDFRWTWADKLENYYVPLDVAKQEDSLALETMLSYIYKYMIEGKDEASLRETLPYKFFLVKELHSSLSETSDCLSTLYNSGQNTIFVGYMSSETEAYDEATLGMDLSSVYMSLVYNALDPKPTDFMDSRETCGTSGLIVLMDNEAIEGEPEWDSIPEFVPRDEYGEVELTLEYYHEANVLGYIKSYGKTGGSAPMYIPDEATDYGDYRSFITNQPGSYIRERTQYYWRIAKRATLLIEYCAETQGEDLIAIQNANFPDDPVTMEDFAYVDRY